MIKKERQLLSGKRPLSSSKATVWGRQTFCFSQNILIWNRVFRHLYNSSKFLVFEDFHDSTKNHTHEKVRHISEFTFDIYWLWKIQKIRILKKWKRKKKMEILSLYTCVPKTTIMWGTVPQIRSETIFFCHFGPLFALKTQKNKILKKWKKHLEIIFNLSSFQSSF